MTHGDNVVFIEGIPSFHKPQALWFADVWVYFAICQKNVEVWEKINHFIVEGN